MICGRFQPGHAEQRASRTHLVSRSLGLLAALDNTHERAHDGVVALKHELLVFAVGGLSRQRASWLLLWVKAAAHKRRDNHRSSGAPSAHLAVEHKRRSLIRSCTAASYQVAVAALWRLRDTLSGWLATSQDADNTPSRR